MKTITPEEWWMRNPSPTAQPTDILKEKDVVAPIAHLCFACECPIPIPLEYMQGFKLLCTRGLSQWDFQMEKKCEDGKLMEVLGRGGYK